MSTEISNLLPKKTCQLAVYALLLVIVGILGLTYSKARHVMTNHALLKAIGEKNIVAVTDALNRGADPNTILERMHDQDDVPEQFGVHEIVKQLMGKSPQGDRWTALMLAAQGGETDVVKLLLDRKAAINVQNKGGSTALSLAAEEGHIGVVRLLLQHDANVSIAAFDSDTSLSDTALSLASQASHTEIVNMLLDRGANVNRIDNNGYTPLYWAVYEGDLEMVKILLSHGAKAGTKGKNVRSPLSEAAFSGQYAITKALINSGADANAVADSGVTPLCTAEMMGHPDIVALLKKAGAKEEK